VPGMSDTREDHREGVHVTCSTHAVVGVRCYGHSYQKGLLMSGLSRFPLLIGLYNVVHGRYTACHAFQGCNGHKQRTCRQLAALGPIGDG
jgi:hypothetical protein